MSHGAPATRSASLLAVLLVPLAVACGGDRSADDHVDPPTAAGTVPGGCVDVDGGTRPRLDGEAVWVRFCPGRRGSTVPAEVPSDALTTHLGVVEELDEVDPTDGSGSDPGDGCGPLDGRTYRLQVGYDDGRVEQVTGGAGPDCPGTLVGGDRLVRGPDDLGVYGAVMAAFGQQHADGFAATQTGPLTCPVGPRDPDGVDTDGASADLDTGWSLGGREPMLMPLTAVRGILCTWPSGAATPTMRELTATEAERVRIGMHALFQAMVDCEPTPEIPSYAAVVEDATGTRRAVGVIGSECSTVVRSDDGYGLGFAWLADTARPGP